VVEHRPGLGCIDEDDSLNRCLSELVDIADLPLAAGRHLDLSLLPVDVDDAGARFTLVTSSRARSV
jgi:hypothetical protein